MTTGMEGLEVDALSITYPIGQGPFRPRLELKAVREVSLSIAPGKTLGVVGESGCGKSTLARGILRLQRPDGGTVRWNGQSISDLTDDEFRHVRPEMQMVFQDPLASLNPRMRVADIIAEPLVTHRPELSGSKRQALVAKAMERVGLLPDMARRFPHEFSGGQAQRIGIARAIVLEPGLLICDEAVSALDVSIRAQVLVLLEELQQTLGLAILFISHDLAVVRYIAHEVMVLYLGRVVEHAERDTLFANPKHPYTQALIGSVLSKDPEIERSHEVPRIGGELPSPIDPPSGCPFNTRCPLVQPICRQTMPALVVQPDGSQVACHVVEAQKAA
ncbi:ABC transporter ATP-binding protein [Pelagibacterium sediminicola]|uniref:ABC transporter ATP-binding protein n=1 Tax=Pelagibacterium sediminicola TaxID=2248761 RepID=UPI000E31DADA|nr:oligopeptide/dipeptide ABC transporter ATP-binding protein [Pelagibacterium sediminicola]